MNKLRKLLTSGASVIRGVRANLVSEDMQHAQVKLIDRLKEERRRLERKKLSLSDLYSDSELSLKVVKKDFNADSWSTDMQNVSVALLNNEIELTVAKNTFDEWFEETITRAPAKRRRVSKKKVKPASDESAS